VDQPTILRVPVRGGDLVVARWGPGHHAVPMVLAVHGGTSSHLAWSLVASHLVPQRSVLAPDLRGAAAGSDLPPPYGMAAHADDLVRVLDHLGIDRCPIVGWSLGGFVAASTAVRHPDRCTGLVLVDGGVGQPLPADMSRDDVLQAFVEPALAQLTTAYPSVDSYVQYWRDHPAFAGEGAFGPAIEAHARAGLVGEPPELRAWTNLEAMRADVADTLFDPLTHDAVRHLSVPTTFIRCERGLVDEPVGYYGWPGFPELLAELGIPLIDVPDVNHWTLMFAEPGASIVADAILSVPAR
jgi:pimeloyl-ACP methyl ester carboxylesterase